MRVLFVEDEQKVANALQEGLEGEKYDVVVERTGEGAFFRVTTETFDVILLDLGLPGRSGLEILAALRERGLKTPVLVLTARDSVQDRVLGLDGGADDYLVKPFAFTELVARLRDLVWGGSEKDEHDPRTASSDTSHVQRNKRCASSNCSSTCCATTARWCRARRWRATCGARRRARRLSTTSSTSTSRGCGARWTWSRR